MTAAAAAATTTTTTTTARLISHASYDHKHMLKHLIIIIVNKSVIYSSSLSRAFYTTAVTKYINNNN